MRHKKILIWSLVFASIFVVVLGLAGWLIYSSFIKRFGVYEPPETPSELRQPRVVIGAEFLARNKFDTTNQFGYANDLGSIEDIAVGELDSDAGIDIAIAGSYGALIVDRNGAKRSQIQYEFEIENRKVGPFNTQSPGRMLGDVQVIDIEGDGSCEYLARGGIDGAAVFSHQGKRLWAYGKFTDEKTSIDDLAVGDIDGDGVGEFIAGWNAVELFDRQGSKRWTQPWDGPFYQIEVVDVDGDLKNEILHSTGSGLMIRDRRGQVVKEVDMPFYLSRFHLCAMPDQKERSHILVVEDDYVWLTDFEGKVVNKFAAPLSRFSAPSKPSDSELGIGRSETSVYKAKGVWVKLKENDAAFLAVVTEFAAIDRSVLYIYSAEGTLVYQEVLPEQSSSIAVLSQEGGRRAQELLIGGTETVWRYSAR